MDRSALAQWLSTPSRTFRWSPEAKKGYQAVEVGSGKLSWYAWSHEYGSDGGGRTELASQTIAEFLADGPPVPMPDSEREDLDRFVGELVGRR